jgi:carboxymethylenebutenolidase
MSSNDAGHAGQTAGEAFLVNPRGGEKGPGVLLLHSWWGLTEEIKDLAERLADEGYTVIAPDLLGGQRPATAEEGEAALAALSPDDLSGLVLSSAHAVRSVARDKTAPIGVVGLSMGGSMALWLSARLPESVAAVVTFYGAQSIDFDDATARYLGHFGDEDHMVSEEDRVVTESFIRLGENETDFHVYQGAGHWFFEHGEHHDPEAAEVAWSRTVEFLASVLQPER